MSKRARPDGGGKAAAAERPRPPPTVQARAPTFVDAEGWLYSTPIEGGELAALVRAAGAAFGARALRVDAPAYGPRGAADVAARCRRDGRAGATVALMHIASQYAYSLHVSLGYYWDSTAAATPCFYVVARELRCVGELVDPRPFLRHIVSPQTASALRLRAPRPPAAAAATTEEQEEYSDDDDDGAYEDDDDDAVDDYRDYGDE